MTHAIAAMQIEAQGLSLTTEGKSKLYGLLGMQINFSFFVQTVCPICPDGPRSAENLSVSFLEDYSSDMLVFICLSDEQTVL